MLLLAPALFSACGNRQPIVHPPLIPGKDLNSVGLKYYHEGNLAAAEEHLLRSLAACEAIDYIGGKARTLYNLALVHRDVGKLDDALEELRLAEILFVRLESSKGVSRTLAAQATIHEERNRLDEARFKYGKALERAPEELASEILTNLAIVHLKMKDLEQARSLAEEAVSRSANNLVLADSLFNLARIQIESEEYSASEQRLLRVLELDREAGRRLRLAETLTMLGNVSLLKGSERDASSYYRRAAGIYEALGRKEDADRMRHATETPEDS